MLKRALLAIVAVAVVTTSGCSSSPEPTAPSDPPASTAPASSVSASSSTATPASSCLTGRYRLARFVGVGANSTYGTGQGGDITVAFNDGKYTMTGAGKDPVTVTLAGQSAPLLVDGTVDGTYRGTGEEVTFAKGKATGSATVTAQGAKRTLTMAQIANVLAPNESGKLSCTPGQLTITLADVRLELTR